MRVTLLIPLLLTACTVDGNDPGPHPPPPSLVAEADLLAALDRSPRPLPPLRAAALGEGGTLTGPTSPALPVGQTVSLQGHSAQGAQHPIFHVPEAGRLVARGQVELRLPPVPDLGGSERLTPLEFAREFDAFEPCAVDTLATAPGQEGVHLARVDALTRNPYIGAAPLALGDHLAGSSDLRPATSPPPAFLNVLPYQAVNTREVSEETGLLVYADGDVQLRGELRCVFRYVTRVEDATQYNLFVNLDLRRGWNVVRRRLDGSVPRGVMEVVDLTLTGGAPDYTLRPGGLN